MNACRRFLTLAIVVFGSWATPLVAGQCVNVILLIGDGMGPEQVRAANYYHGGPLSFETFPHKAVMTTYSASSAVTDSAASGTAIATGHKVNNSVVSKAYPANDAYALGEDMETLLEYFKARGKRTGLVTTTYMTHATPATFGAHETSRNNYPAIANDYVTQSRPNVLFGGSRYMPAQPEGYTVVTDRASMLALDTETATMVSGQFGNDYIPYEFDGSYATLPHLSEMTRTALAILDNDPDGFFLMVEGGRIDHAGHMPNSDPLLKTQRNIAETIEFAAAVQEVINWAAGRDDTLILVTADHETGDLTVLGDNGAGNLPDVSWGSTGHTDTPVPVYAWGQNAALVSGAMDNTDIFAIATVPEPSLVDDVLVVATMLCLACFVRTRRLWAASG